MSKENIGTLPEQMSDYHIAVILNQSAMTWERREGVAWPHGEKGSMAWPQPGFIGERGCGPLSRSLGGGRGLALPYGEVKHRLAPAQQGEGGMVWLQPTVWSLRFGNLIDGRVAVFLILWGDS